MIRIKLKKNIICPGPINKFGRRIVKIEKGTEFWYDKEANSHRRMISVCKRYEKISKYECKYYYCLTFPKEEFNNLFEVMYEI